jgi:hypothetical protein
MKGMIENHKRAATHLETAAKYHKEAVGYHVSGDHDKALLSTVRAHGHTIIASELQREFLKYKASTQ